MEPYDPDQGGMDTGLFGAIILWGALIFALGCCGAVWWLLGTRFVGAG